MHYPGIEEHMYWNGCACNEIEAITRRHYLPTIEPDSLYRDNLRWEHLDEELGAIADTILENGFLEKVDHATLMRNTRAKIKGRYKAAYNNILTGRSTTREASSAVNAFVKYEKIPLGKLEANKPPRLIQFRSYEYLYRLKSYILSFDLFVKSNDFKINQQPISTILTKLHNNAGVARVLRENWEYFPNTVAICKDAKMFDGHYKEENLMAEHKFWLKLFNNNRELKHLLDAQLDTYGKTQNGIRFEGDATRCSGEYTTSNGNSMSNYSYLARYCKASGLKEGEFRICVNGDDSVLFVDSSNLHKLLPDEWFKNYGMEVLTDKVCRDFCQISYCQTNPIRVQRGGELIWYMVKEPMRTISRMCFSPADALNSVDRYLSSVGLCELAVSSGVPILQAVAMKTMSLGGFSRPLGSVDRYPALLSGNSPVYGEIAPETRRDFEEAFGFSILEQLEIEKQIAGHLKTDPLFNNYTIKYTNFVLNSSKKTD